MLLELKRPGEALEAYRVVLQEAPNRFDALLGAAKASQAAGDTHSAHNYYAQLAAVADPSADRPELKEIKEYLAARK
jgi:thioredoxin-like negative regulator of GroEL